MIAEQTLTPVEQIETSILEIKINQLIEIMKKTGLTLKQLDNANKVVS